MLTSPSFAPSRTTQEGFYRTKPGLAPEDFAASFALVMGQSLTHSRRYQSLIDDLRKFLAYPRAREEFAQHFPGIGPAEKLLDKLCDTGAAIFQGDLHHALSNQQDAEREDPTLNGGEASSTTSGFPHNLRKFYKEQATRKGSGSKAI